MAGEGFQTSGTIYDFSQASLAAALWSQGEGEPWILQTPFKVR